MHWLRAHSRVPFCLDWHRGAWRSWVSPFGDGRRHSPRWPSDRMSPVSIIALFWAMCSTAQQSLLSWAGSGQGHWPGARSQALGQVPSLAERRGSQHRGLVETETMAPLSCFSMSGSGAPAHVVWVQHGIPPRLPAIPFLLASLSLGMQVLGQASRTSVIMLTSKELGPRECPVGLVGHPSQYGPVPCRWAQHSAQTTGCEAPRGSLGPEARVQGGEQDTLKRACGSWLEGRPPHTEQLVKD